MSGLKLAFACGLSDKKLAQKLLPLQAMNEVERIYLYRRNEFSGDKIHWMRMPDFFSRFAPLGDIWRLAALIKNAGDYDALIGCQQRFHGVYAAAAGRLSKTDVIQVVTTDPEWIQKGFLEKWALKNAQAVGFRGNITLNRFRNVYGDKQPLFVVQNVWGFPEKGDQQEDQVDKTVDLLYVGNMVGCKNIPAWIEAASTVKARRGKLTAVMAGGKPGRKVSKMIKRMNLTDDIDFPGFLRGRDLERCYELSRVLLMTSFREGLPMAVLEAMASGLPVVATDVGDTAELVQNGENGFLTGVGDVNASADAVLALLEDEELYRRMSENAYRTAEAFIDGCSLERISKVWRDLFVRLGVIKGVS